MDVAVAVRAFLREATADYTFGRAIEAAVALQEWLDPDEKYQLKNAAKRAWVAYVIESLQSGHRLILHPAAFGVKAHWKRDVLEGARARGLPF